MKWLTPIFLLFLNSCDSSDDEVMVSETFFIESSINSQVLDGFDNNDEFIEVDFIVFNATKRFSYLEAYWQHANGQETKESIPFRIDLFQLTSNGDTLSYTYSINEANLYSLFLNDLDSINRNDQFTLKWSAYGHTSNVIAESDLSLTTMVQCPVVDQFLTGRYFIDSKLDDIGFSSQNLIKEDTVNISTGNDAYSRLVPINFSSFEVSFSLNLNCNGIIVPEQNIGISCTNGIFFRSSNVNSIDYLDDNQIRLNFTVDVYNDCGINDEEEIILIKI